MIIQAIRSAIFYLLFVLITLVLALVVFLGALVPPVSRRIALAIAQTWTYAIKAILWLIVGIRTEVSGLENIPEGACIIASKHQSDLDTITLYPLLDHPAFIAKKELFKIPFVGTTLRLMGTIAIERSRKSGALSSLVSQSKENVAKGRRIFIFPEGTRKEPLAPAEYKFGVAKLYEALAVPVVPVALNSGLYWGRNSLILWPGTARVRFLPPIPAGLGARQMHEKLAREIEKASTQLVLEAVEKGVSRPIDDKFRHRIEMARQPVESETA